MNRLVEPMRPASYRDILDAPDDMVAELIRGALHTQPRPAKPHGRAASALGTEIHMAFDIGCTGPGGWWIFNEPEVHFAQSDVLVPDVAGWRRETLPELGADAYFDIAPDWVCEVLSPRTREYDVTEKRDIYAAHGVGHLWFVDPDAHTIEAFELESGSWRLLGAAHADAEASFAPFEAITISLAGLWIPRP